MIFCFRLQEKISNMESDEKVQRQALLSTPVRSMSEHLSIPIVAPKVELWLKMVFLVPSAVNMLMFLYSSVLLRSLLFRTWRMVIMRLKSQRYRFYASTFLFSLSTTISPIISRETIILFRNPKVHPLLLIRIMVTEMQN